MSRRSTARGDMVRSAALLIRERGVEATSVGDVISHAGAPRGSIYHHFPGGKTQLVEEATRSAGVFIGTMLTDNLSERGLIATLDVMLDFYRSQLLDTDFAAGCPIGAVGAEGPNTPSALLIAGESFDSWESAVAAALRQQGVSRERSESLATTALALVEGALLMSKAQRSTRALDRAGSEMRRMITSAVAAEQL